MFSETEMEETTSGRSENEFLVSIHFENRDEEKVDKEEQEGQTEPHDIKRSGKNRKKPECLNDYEIKVMNPLIASSTLELLTPII